MAKQDDWDFIADYAIEYIQKKARANDLRNEYYILLSENRWRTKNFSNLIDTILDSDRRIEEAFAREGDRWDDYMTAGTEAMIDGHFASCVLDSRDVADALPNRTYDEMKDAAAIYSRLSGQRRASSMRHGRDDGRRDDRRDGRSERRVERRYEGLGGNRHRSSDSKVAAGGNDAWSIIQGAGREEEEERRPREREVEREERRPVAREEQEVPYVKPEPEVVYQERPRFEGIDYTKARPFDEFWKDGKHYQAAHLSNWRLTGDHVNPISTTPQLYDTRAYIRYFVRDERNEITEELMPVTNESRYLAHETQARPEAVEARPRARAAVSLTALTGNKNDNEEDSTLTAVEEPKRSYPLAQLISKVEYPERANFNADTGMLGCVFNSRAKLMEANQSSRVDFHLIRTPLVASSWDQLALIEEVNSSITLTQAAEKLNALKPKFDISIWNTLNRRFSDMILRSVTFQFQLPGLKGFSFANDWLKLIAWYEKKRDASESAEFARRAIYVIGAACAHMDRSEVASFMEDLWVASSENSDVPTVVFIDFVAMASIAETADDLGIGSQLSALPTGASVTNSNPELRNALSNFYRGCETRVAAPGRVRTYITTSDNYLIEVIPYATRQDNFILAEV